MSMSISYFKQIFKVFFGAFTEFLYYMDIMV